MRVMAHLTLRLLGSIEASATSTPVIAFPTKKSKALLAYLATQPGRSHSREKLAGLLWGSSGDSRARISLRQTLTRLRKSLSHSNYPCIVGEGDTLRIDPAAVDVDVRDFERLCEAGTPEMLEQAIELYTGDFLEDFNLKESMFEEWLTEQRDRWRERALDAMTKLLNHHLNSGDTERGIAAASRLLSIDPLQEHAHRALMRLYVQQGRRMSALKQYRLCRELLNRDVIEVYVFWGYRRGEVEGAQIGGFAGG